MKDFWDVLSNDGVLLISYTSRAISKGKSEGVGERWSC
jgi:hypothetical protein